MKRRQLFSKTMLLLTALFFLFTSCNVNRYAAYPPKNASHLIQQLHNPQHAGVMVAAHRGDWRNAPENSILALENSIAMGVDIMEIDLKKTKDGVLILMHDRTIDRTTSGKGKPEDYTWQEIQKFTLRNGLGRITEHKIPTFKEFLLAAKGRILIDVDKGYDYFLDVVKLLRETGTLEQTIINVNDNTTLDEVEAKYGKVPEDIILMPIVAFKDKAKAQQVIKSYLPRRNTIFQMVWSDDAMIADEDFIALKKQDYGVWLNSLWASLNGGHDDDRAVEQNQPNETWGWLIEKGATIIQTDRPKELLEYINSKK